MITDIILKIEDDRCRRSPGIVQTKTEKRRRNKNSYKKHKANALYPSHTGGKQAYGFLCLVMQKKMYNYVHVSREKWCYVDIRRMKVALSVDIT